MNASVKREIMDRKVCLEWAIVLTLTCIRVSRIQCLELRLELRYEWIHNVICDMSTKVELRLGTVRALISNQYLNQAIILMQYFS